MAQTTSLAPFDVRTLRAREFPALAETTYLNAASVTPLPERARAAMEGYNRRRSRIHELEDDDFEPTLRRAREAAARLVGADADEIALMPNTSHGINLAAQCLPVPPGSTVVVSDGEFPANVYPWMGGASRARLEIVPADPMGRPDEDRLLERLDRGDVSIFALSAVQFATGFRGDLPKLGRFCRERGIFFVVDAIQALGQLPLDVREAEVDVLATGGHKWLCAPFGTGFAYVRRELLPRMEPRVVGWSSMRACTDLSRLLDYQYGFCDEARKFEVGTPPFQDLPGFTAALELLMEVGVERIRAHLAEILEPLYAWTGEHPEVEVVSDPRPERRSGIFCFRPPAPEAAFAALRDAGVVCVLREGAIRVSPHLYNDAADVRRVVEVLERGGAA
ncbi:MAG TPA: aminotransferase class V-fold PLP-dependent enzyme [Longimicrobiaceae bacterium]|nr:aminotransferase class V-fold PLP-dependent enzyme [Longimicrobiaceae bacterium]